MRTRRVLVAVCALALVGAIPGGQGEGGAARDGVFSAPFAEPTVGGETTTATCVEADDGSLDCKPAAGSLAMLPSGPEDVLYFNALEGTENVRGSIVSEFGTTSINAQARRMDLGGVGVGTAGSPTWEPTLPEDGGGNRDGFTSDETLLPPGLGNTSGDSDFNAASLFCADLNLLADGRVVVAGGTTYYQEPGIPGVPLGVVELEGMKNTRVYDPETNEWAQLPSMNFGRWYPTMVTLADGSQFIASGVTKLLKPVYLDRPLDSLRNVVQTEIQDPQTGEWALTGNSGDRSLPLFPRLHLLPNGDVFYNTAGQVFNPFGQAYDEALWSIAASFDPDTNSWTDLGIPGLNELLDLENPEAAADRLQEIFPDDPAAAFEELLDQGQSTVEALANGLTEMDLGPAVQGMLGMLSNQGLEGIGNLLGAGFRGSTFSVMMPLEPGDDGSYTSSEFLTAGGIIGPTPGTYIPIPFSRVDTVDTAGSTDLSTRFVGSMNTGRFYSTGVPLPTGEVVAFSGSTADEVVGPGTGFPVTQAELYDPATETWRPVAEQARDRVYHNTASLMPDGRVLVGGHDMISTLYGPNVTIPGGFTPVGRDPSFEIFEPPYLHYGVDQANLSNVPAQLRTDGGEVSFSVDVDPDEIESVVLYRNTTITHLVDGDQRTVSLPIVDRGADTVTVRMPSEDAVAPPGAYLLFANRTSDQGAVPSVGAQVTVPFDGTYAQGEVDLTPRPEPNDNVSNLLPSLGEALGTNPQTTPGSDGTGDTGGDTGPIDEAGDAGDTGPTDEAGDDASPSAGDAPSTPSAPGLPGLPGGDDGDGGGGLPGLPGLPGLTASGDDASAVAPPDDPVREELRASLLATPVDAPDRSVPITLAVLVLASSAAVVLREWRPRLT